MINMAEMVKAEPIGEKKSLILHRTLRLFLSFGIRAVSTKDISDSLGISKKTLYLFFGTKENLVKECVKKLVDLQLKEIHLIEIMSVSRIKKVFLIYKSNLRNIANHHLSFYNDMKRDYPETYRYYNALCRDFINNKVFHLLSESQRENEILDAFDLDLFCEVNLFRLADFFLSRELHHEDHQEHVLDHMILISLRGILKNPDSIDWR